MMHPRVRSELIWEIGKRIRFARMRRRLTTAQLAKLLKIGRNTIQRYELGYNNIPLERALALCDALRVTPLYLFSLEKRPLEVSEIRPHVLKLAMRLEKLPDPMRTLLFNTLNEICKKYESLDDEKSNGNGEPSTTVGALVRRIGDRTVDRTGSDQPHGL